MGCSSGAGTGLRGKIICDVQFEVEEHKRARIRVRVTVRVRVRPLGL